MNTTTTWTTSTVLTFDSLEEANGAIKAINALNLGVMTASFPAVTKDGEYTVATYTQGN